MSDQNLSARLESETYLDASAAAALIPDCTAQTVRRWAREGRIPVVTMPSGRMRFRKSDIVDMLTPRLLSPSASSADESDDSVELPGQEALSW